MNASTSSWQQCLDVLNNILRKVRRVQEDYINLVTIVKLKAFLNICKTLGIMYFVAFIQGSNECRHNLPEL